MYKTRIQSTGMYVPEKVVTNKDLEKMMDTSDEWIQKRSGIEQRRWVGPNDTTLSMAVAASKMAIERADIAVDDIDAILFGCLLSDYPFPGTGCLLQRELGFKNNVPALDIRNQCSGYLYGLQVADAWIKCGMYKRVLLVGSEIHSTSMDISDNGRDIGVLFGDGAGATILERSDDESEVIDTLVFSEGQYAEKLALMKPSPNDQPRLAAMKGSEEIPQSWWPVMDGKFVFKNAVTRMPEALKEICKKHDVALTDIKKIIPHQANIRINNMIIEGLGLDKTVAHHTIQKYGNTTMASIPITLHDALEKNQIQKNDLISFIAFGAGFTWGASLIKF